MSTKDVILGTSGVPANRYGAPPIDSSLQGGADSPAVVPKPVQPAQPVQQVQPQSNVGGFPPPIDSSLQGRLSPVSPDAKSLGEDKQAEPTPKPASTPHTETPAEGTATQPVNSSTGQTDGEDGKGKHLSYVEMFQKLNPYNPPTDEELEKERKKRKREAIFNAIGDGIQALSNLYFTTQYAPNSYNPANSLSAKAKERWDKVDAERKANKEAYYRGLMQAQAADDEHEQNDRTWLRLLERDKKTDAQQEFENKITQAKADREKELENLNIQLYNHKITAAEADAKRKEVEAKYADKYQQARVEHEKAAGAASRASAGAANASASASRARGRYYDRGGSSKKAEFIGYDKDGKAHYFTDPKAAEQFARREGTWTEDEDVSTTTRIKKKGVTTTTVSKTKGDGYSKPKFNVNDHKKGGGGSKTTTKPPLN